MPRHVWIFSVPCPLLCRHYETQVMRCAALADWPAPEADHTTCREPPPPPHTTCDTLVPWLSLISARDRHNPGVLTPVGSQWGAMGSWLMCVYPLSKDDGLIPFLYTHAHVNVLLGSSGRDSSASAAATWHVTHGHVTSPWWESVCYWITCRAL